MKRTKTIIGIAATMCCLTVATHAALLLPGGTAALAPQGIGGTLVAGIMSSPYLFDSPPGPPAQLDGDIKSAVYKSDPANPFGLGNLSFYYQVTTIPGGIDNVSRFTAAGYAGFSAFASVVFSGGTGAPFADRSGGLGNVIGWDFAGLGIPTPGGFSDIFVVHTDAKFWTLANGSVIDGGAANAPVFAPSAVPEPTTVIAGALLLLPFGASTIRYFRKNRMA